MCEQREIVNKLCAFLSPLGFEAHPFKVGLYNDCVAPSFQLPYPYDTLAIVVISTPRMFDKSFKPFVCQHQDLGNLRDPIDECMVHYFNRAKQLFPARSVESFHDFELLPNRRPKILMQTAGHVSGAAYYYQRSGLKRDPWDSEQKIFGVCVHPKYGGWFGLRGILVFTDVSAYSLNQRSPLDVLPGDEDRIDLLERLNFHWEDWTFRDMIPVEEKYGDEQKRYFETKPEMRRKTIENLRREWTQQGSGTDF